MGRSQQVVSESHTALLRRITLNGSALANPFWSMEDLWLEDEKRRRHGRSRGFGDRHWWLLVSLGLATLAVHGCRPTQDRAASRGSTLTMAVRDVRVLLPDTDVDFLVFVSLTDRNERGEVVPRLARSWEHSADYREWTYHLRTDVRWHDGARVTAHDVKFTLDLLSHPDVAEYIFESVTVRDDSTVTIRATRPNYQDDIVYYPKHLLEGLDPRKFQEWEFWTHPVGSGPFRFVRYLPETMIEFEANPDYYRGKPKIERVVLKFVGKAGGLAELMAGNVDVVHDAEEAQTPRVAADARFRAYHPVVANNRAIYWKNDHFLFRDPRVRRALTLAIDRRELLLVLNLPEDLPLTDGVFTLRQRRNSEFPIPLPYEPAKAQALLDAAGWRDADGDGVRAKNGQPFRFTAIVWNDDGLDRLAEVVQARLRLIGVAMEIQLLDNPLVWDRLRTGKFEAAFMFHKFDAQWQRKYFGAGNPIGYRSPAAAELIERLVATADPDETDRLYRALTEIYRVDLPVTWLVPWTTTFFAHRRVRGLRMSTDAEPTQYMEDLWLEDEK